MTSAPPHIPSVRDEDALRTITALQRTALETQMEMARKYPRDPAMAIENAKAIATQSQEVAEACMYAMPRGDKKIDGPSVRLAEIVASQWGHLMTQARVLVIGDKEITAQGRCVDLESGNAVEIETRRRITNKKGRYNDDMITVTGNAACAIAFRNAVFKVIPAALVQSVYMAVKALAVGKPNEVAARREKLIARLQEAYQISIERILAAVGVESVEEIGLDEIETLIGYGTAISNGDMQAKDAFPPPGANKSNELNEALSQVETQTQTQTQTQVAPSEEAAQTQTPSVEASNGASAATPAAPSSPDGPPLKLATEGAALGPSPEPAVSAEPQSQPQAAAPKPGPIDMVIMAMAEKGALSHEVAEQRLNNYSQKKFRRRLDELSPEQMGSLRTDIRVIVDLDLIQ